MDFGCDATIRAASNRSSRREELRAEGMSWGCLVASSLFAAMLPADRGLLHGYSSDRRVTVTKDVS